MRRNARDIATRQLHGVNGVSNSRRVFLRAGIAAWVAAEIGPVLAAGKDSVEAPEYRVGDRWTYKAKDGTRNPVRWEETHEVIAIGAEGIRSRVTQKGPTVDNTREELWTAPGLVAQGALADAETRRFSVPLKRFEFPLAPGKVWNQTMRNFNEELKREGEINRRVRVVDWGSVSTPAGTFDALRLRVNMWLDDGEFYRQRSQCTYLTWYAPKARNCVRDERRAQYIEGSGRDAATIQSQNAILELVSYTAG